MSTHNRVVGILRELIEEDKETYSEVDPPTSVFDLESVISKYNPDVHASCRRQKGLLDVFQVWHGETIEVAVFDILRCAMIPEIRRLHIVLAQKQGYPLWKEENVVWELKKRLLSVLAEPYKKRLEQFLVPGCVCNLSEEDLTKDDAHLRSKIAKSLAFE